VNEPAAWLTRITYSAVEKSFRRVRERLVEKAAPYSLHGLRKLAAPELAEAGCSDSDSEIQAVTGHSSLEMVQYYRKRANRKRMSKTAQDRRATPGTNGG
jgi:integrase